MTHRIIDLPAGNRRVIEFTTTYSQDWSVVDKRGDNIESADVDSATFLLKRKIYDADADADAEKAVGTGIVITSGKVTVTLDAADTASLQGKYFATLRLYLADGGVVDWLDADYDDTPFMVLNFTQGAVEAVE